MLYLIVDGDGVRRCDGRCSEAAYTLPRMREAVERTFPGREVRGPVQPHGRGFLPVTVYLSPNKEGIGRNNKLYQWAVAEKEKTQ